MVRPCIQTGPARYPRSEVEDGSMSLAAELHGFRTENARNEHLFSELTLGTLLSIPSGISKRKSVLFPSYFRATPRLMSRSLRQSRFEIRPAKPYTKYRSLLRAFIGVYKCASALRLATIPSNKVARNSAP